MTSEPPKQTFRRGKSEPLTRMLDYGMRREAAEQAHRALQEGQPWDQALVDIAEAERLKARSAEETTDLTAAREYWLSAATALNFAQMTFALDGERKARLYQQLIGCFAKFAGLVSPPARKLEVPFGSGALHAWHFPLASDGPSPVVIVFGGLNGWAIAYSSMAEALRAQGIACLLVDGPGQGQSRLDGRVYLDAHVTKAFSRFVDVALDLASGSGAVGLWGNSFGGLFAALTAAADPRISACCINGAPTRSRLQTSPDAAKEPPALRTAKEQLAAMCGRRELAGLEVTVEALSFQPNVAPILCPLLVLEGGADPLVLPNTQQAFLIGNRSPSSRLLTWRDGEHTLYNYASERDATVSGWFAERLAEAIARNAA
ncbi:alpha/beta fold hydrolase [Bradyrhizobium sp. RDM4]|uniref:alpha/beta fold hydrolase n=1 Tax=Bradyrhizobium sp. RDM4 TaxID=3378765 RepID=UPI0038FC566A